MDTERGNERKKLSYAKEEANVLFQEIQNGAITPRALLFASQKTIKKEAPKKETEMGGYS